jgi:Sel1 repeat
VLPSQPDHQTKRLFYRLLLGCMSGSFLGFGHQPIIDLDIGAHRRAVVMCSIEFYNTHCVPAIAAFYAEGRGGLPKDDREAARLYKLAAEQGLSFAQYDLGVFYEKGGGGLPRNQQEAARLYKLAADQGHARARAALQAMSRAE